MIFTADKHPIDHGLGASPLQKKAFPDVDDAMPLEKNAGLIMAVSRTLCGDPCRHLINRLTRWAKRPTTPPRL
jgi:hypothetical protein